MIEVVAAVSAASSAFSAIKKGFEVGRDIESMAGDLGRWMGAVSDIKKAEEYNQKPPLFKKLFASGSIEQEALEIFMAKKKADDMREQLRQIITYTRGPTAWQELIKTEHRGNSGGNQHCNEHQGRRFDLEESDAEVS